MKKTIIFVLLAFLSQFCFAQQTTIKGTAPSYAGKTIEVKYHQDPFTYHENIIGSFKVDEKGNFSYQFDNKTTRLVFLPLGIYKAFLYVEPNSEYQLRLPKKRELSTAQLVNPYFEHEEIMLGVLNDPKTGINRSIRQFDDQLDAFINQNFHKIYRRKERSLGIDFAKQIKKQFRFQKNVFFQEYCKYRLAFLEYLAYPKQFTRIENQYFNNQKIQLNNPAYMSLFKKQYGNFFNGYLSQKEGIALSKAFENKQAFEAISSLLKKYPAYEKASFRKLIIANATFDSYHRKFISKQKALDILNSLQQNAATKYNQQISKNFIASISHLQNNSAAPNFKIGKYDLAKYKGKYLYLNFCNTQILPCQQDFKEMEKLKKQFGKHIEFLSIACDFNLIKMHDYLKTQNFSWPIVPLGKEHHLLKEYKIKAFPKYILIDPKGNIESANAPGPRENIQMQFIKISRNAIRKAYKQQK
jgi:thiol-disulfide isomerase/thioredoxin